jgi:rare lipoprotein A
MIPVTSKYSCSQLTMARLLSTIAIAVILAGCGRKQTVQYATQTGIASWYGMPFHGRHTASGEIFDMEKHTAAHRTLPFGTIVRVEHLLAHKSIDVRINDRGPFVAGRIIDLSRNAAQSIGIQSIADVRLEIIEQPRSRGADLYAVQIGTFGDRTSAESARENLHRRYGAARLVFRDGDQTWRVLVGLEPSLERAERLAAQLQNRPGGAFVVCVDDTQE